MIERITEQDGVLEIKKKSYIIDKHQLVEKSVCLISPAGLTVMRYILFFFSLTKIHKHIEQ
jgi:hypothetical protein